MINFLKNLRELSSVYWLKCEVYMAFKIIIGWFVFMYGTAIIMIIKERKKM